MKDIESLAYIAIASVGGIAKYLNNILTGKDKIFSVSKLAASAFVSGFSGYMFAEFFYHINPDYMTIAAGVGGFLGGESVSYLAEIFKKRIQ